MCSRHPQSLRTFFLTNVASNKLTVKVVGFFVPLLGIKVFRGPALLAVEFHIVKHYKIYKWKACKHQHLLSRLNRSACNQQNLRLHNLENVLTSCRCTIIEYCLGTRHVHHMHNARTVCLKKAKRSKSKWAPKPDIQASLPTWRLHHKPCPTEVYIPSCNKSWGLPYRFSRATS